MLSCQHHRECGQVCKTCRGQLPCRCHLPTGRTARAVKRATTPNEQLHKPRHYPQHNRGGSPGDRCCMSSVPAKPRAAQLACPGCTQLSCEWGSRPVPSQGSCRWHLEHPCFLTTGHSAFPHTHTNTRTSTSGVRGIHMCTPFLPASQNHGKLQQQTA